MFKYNKVEDLTDPQLRILIAYYKNEEEKARKLRQEVEQEFRKRIMNDERSKWM